MGGRGWGLGGAGVGCPWDPGTASAGCRSGGRARGPWVLRSQACRRRCSCPQCWVPGPSRPAGRCGSCSPLQERVPPTMLLSELGWAEWPILQHGTVPSPPGCPGVPGDSAWEAGMSSWEAIQPEEAWARPTACSRGHGGFWAPVGRLSAHTHARRLCRPAGLFPEQGVALQNSKKRAAWPAGAPFHRRPRHSQGHTCSLQLPCCSISGPRAAAGETWGHQTLPVQRAILIKLGSRGSLSPSLSAPTLRHRWPARGTPSRLQSWGDSGRMCRPGWGDGGCGRAASVLPPRPRTPGLTPAGVCA